VLEERVEDWPLRDGQGEIVVAERRWIPRLVLRPGQPVVSTLRLVCVRRHGARSRRLTPIHYGVAAVDRIIAHYRFSLKGVPCMPASVRNVAREKLEQGQLSRGVGVRMTRSVEIA